MSEDLKLTTYGVKVTAEVKEKIKSLMESSGLQGKEFIETLLELFETNLIKINSQY